MSVLSTLKQGYIYQKVKDGYQKFLPRTLANLVSMNDGSNVESKISQINTNLSNKSNNGHTHTYSSITGKPSTFTPSTHYHDERYFTESEINNKINTLNNTLNSKPWMFSNGWSKGMRINNVDANARGFQGILIRDMTELYIVWVAGSPGSMGVNLNKVIGTSPDAKPVTVSYSESGKYLQFNCQVDCAMIYIGRY